MAALAQALSNILSFLEAEPRQYVVETLLDTFTEKRINLEKTVTSELYRMFADHPELESWRHLQREYDWLKIATSAKSCISNNLVLHRSELGSYFVLTGNHLCKRCQNLHGMIVKLTDVPEGIGGEFISADPYAKTAVWFGKTRSRARGHKVVPYHLGFCDLDYVAIDPIAQRYSAKYRKISRKPSTTDQTLATFLPAHWKQELQQMEARTHLIEEWAAADRKLGIHRRDAYYYQKLGYYLAELDASDLTERYRADIIAETVPLAEKR